MQDFGKDTEIIWRDRKRWCGLPWSFTRYYLVRKKDSWFKLFTSVGLLSTVDEEVQLFRIFDISLYQNLFDKIFNVGTITLHCNDESGDQVYLQKVKNPIKVRNMISAFVEKERERKGFKLTEFHG